MPPPKPAQQQYSAGNFWTQQRTKRRGYSKTERGGVVRRLFIQQVGHLFKRIKHCEDDECLGRTNVWRVLFDIASAEEAYIVLG